MIAGDWIGCEAQFLYKPASGMADSFAAGTAEMVDAACVAAEEAFWSYGYSSRAGRAAFLRRIADDIEAGSDEITAMGTRETGLSKARLAGERGRTTRRLRLVADHIETGDYLDLRHDEALPERSPSPRPDLRMIQRPIGPSPFSGPRIFLSRDHQPRVTRGLCWAIEKGGKHFPTGEKNGRIAHPILRLT